jgi:hypothetical protein
MNLVGLKELSELLEVPYEKLKVWKSRGRLPEPFQTISGTPVWDWDETEEEFRSKHSQENTIRVLYYFSFRSFCSFIGLFPVSTFC